MDIIAGIGNPGPEYEGTRHNVGFEVVNALAARHGEPATKVRYNALTNEVCVGTRRALLMKPMTFVNLSGNAVGRAASFYKTEPRRVLAICDDADLKLGQIRMRAEGSSGGHNGLKSIEGALGTQSYPRLRIGIGRRAGDRTLTGHVLGRFSASEREAIEITIGQAADAVEMWLCEGVEAAMNRFNGLPDFGE